MGTGCPVCNGLSQLEHNCPDCGAKMIDYGGLESYCDPYGPYEPSGTRTSPETASVFTCCSALSATEA